MILCRSERVRIVSENKVECARQYLLKGWMPIPVPGGSKNPGFKEWQNFSVDESSLLTHFGNGNNIGLLNGKPSGGLIDIDLDWPIAAVLADVFLPSTKMESGRRSSPRS